MYRSNSEDAKFRPTLFLTRRKPFQIKRYRCEIDVFFQIVLFNKQNVQIPRYKSKKQNPKHFN